MSHAPDSSARSASVTPEGLGLGSIARDGAIGTGQLVRGVILAGLLVAVYWHTIRTQLVYRWVNDGTWSYGFLVPLISGYFLYDRREQLARVRPVPSLPGLAVLIGSLAMYTACMFRWIPFDYFRPLSLIGSVFGLVLFLGGWGVIRVTWFAILFLAFSVPIPKTIFVELTRPLQMLASHVTASVLGVFPDVHAEVSGVVIDYTYGLTSGQLNVEEACSGMRSMMAIVTLGVAMSYLGRREVWQRIVLVVACVPIAVCCNVLRVTVTGLLHVFATSAVGKALHFEWFLGPTPHAMFGLVMFLVAMGLFALTAWVLDHLYVETEGDAPDGSPA